MLLYTVRFTTRKAISKYDMKGKLIGQYDGEVAVTHNALPYQAAMSYSGCDNFKIEEYLIDSDQKKPSRRATRTLEEGEEYDAPSPGRWSSTKTNRHGPRSSAAKPSLAPVASLEDAARSGDLGAALGEVA